MNNERSSTVLNPERQSDYFEDVELETQRRYTEGAKRVEQGLCCPTRYEPELLKCLPPEIIEKDYGCGNPSIFVNEGETVVDLGSGAGKICYIVSQKVGPRGRVIGVDCNDAMLQLARKYHRQISEAIGFENVKFVKAKIQDLALDLETLQRWIDRHPIHHVEDLTALEAECDRLRRESPLIQNASVDVVVSNCVLNLVKPQHKPGLFQEIHRVLKPGGRAVISDIVCDEDPTETMMQDPTLWSGCISGAFREDRFLHMFEQAGFYGIEILQYQREPWQTIDGIEFRSMTVRAYKGKEGPCLERKQAVIYKGPWRRVVDDDGHTLHRGQRVAVCDKTFTILTNSAGPYAGSIIPVQPNDEIPLDEAVPFDCKRSTQRHPRETKGQDYRDTITRDEGPCDCGSAEC